MSLPVRRPCRALALAGALRHRGRYDEWLAAIDRALGLLPPGDVSVHADLVRERSLIAAASEVSPYAGTNEGAAR
ncbi:hypothetical protein [Streptomyces sp. NPDC048385]|uniref:hypothetical protein n=1 Tax=Streptomyces sp. NPDC048385 TaxID=3155145 RepID=UPI00341257F5